MKKLIYLFMVCVVILCASCNHEETNMTNNLTETDTSNYSTDIVGDWTLTEATSYSGGVQYDAYEPIYLSVSADHSLVWNIEGFDMYGTWRMSENILIISWEDETEIKWTIKSLTSNKLVLRHGSESDYSELVFSKDK